MEVEALLSLDEKKLKGISKAYDFEVMEDKAIKYMTASAFLF